jgi:Rrf2 family protein
MSVLFSPLSKRVHCALKILVGLACAHGPTRSRELSERTGISTAQTANIRYMLSWRGLASSRRGSTGGFWLRVPSSRIRVQNIVEFLGPPGNRGRKETGDPILQIWRQTVARSGQAFERLTLADLVKKRSASL